MIKTCIRCGRVIPYHSHSSFDERCVKFLGSGDEKTLLEKNGKQGLLYLVQYKELNPNIYGNDPEEKSILASIQPSVVGYRNIVRDLEHLGFHWAGMTTVYLYPRPTISDIENVLYTIQIYPQMYIESESFKEFRQMVESIDYPRLSFRVEGDLGLVSFNFSHLNFERVIRECGGKWVQDRLAWIVPKDYIPFLKSKSTMDNREKLYDILSRIS